MSKLSKLIKNRPQYEIQKEYEANQGLAANQAYGRDRAVTNAETQIDSQAANAFEAARQSSSSTPALMAALTGVQNNATAARGDLVDQEQQSRARGMNNMMQTNSAMAEEKDKAWNTNVNEPYQNQVQRLRDKQKFGRDLLMKGIDLAGSLAVKGATGGLG
jgi:hypothetical protein